MSRMFENYYKSDEQLYACSCQATLNACDTAGPLKLLRDITGKFYGVEAKYGAPFTLYFHITETDNQLIDDVFTKGTIEFRLFSKPNHKLVLSKQFTGNEVFNAITQDISLAFTASDITILKPEVYDMTVTLTSGEDHYMLHTEQDGIISIR